MSFHDAMFSFTGSMQIWFYMLGVIVATSTILLFSKATRHDALIALATNIIVFAAMGWLYKQVGYIRILGIVHVLLWTPLVIYLWHRTKDSEITLVFRLVIWFIVALLLVSLTFDYIDVARYLLGERANLTN